MAKFLAYKWKISDWKLINMKLILNFIVIPYFHNYVVDKDLFIIIFIKKIFFHRWEKTFLIFISSVKFTLIPPNCSKSDILLFFLFSIFFTFLLSFISSDLVNTTSRNYSTLWEQHFFKTPTDFFILIPQHSFSWWLKSTYSKSE